jgi:predicted transcriptional regulator
MQSLRDAAIAKGVPISLADIQSALDKWRRHAANHHNGFARAIHARRCSRWTIHGASGAQRLFRHVHQRSEPRR